MKTTSSTSFPAQTTSGHRVYSTSFRYGQYRVELCSQGISWLEARPRYHSGGANYGPTEQPPAPSTYCEWYVKGSKWVKDSTTNVTWNAGVKIAPVIGVDLTSRAGYDTSVKQSFDFSAGGLYVCGEWAGPAHRSGRLTVKSTRSQ